MHASPDPAADRALDPRARQVIEAAAILEIPEYELLAMAFREWFGRAPRRQDLDALFGPYMFDGVTPYWAVALARQVIALHEQGRLDHSRFRAPSHPPATLRDIVTGIGQSVLLLALVGFIWYLASDYPPLH